MKRYFWVLVGIFAVGLLIGIAPGVLGQIPSLRSGMTGLSGGTAKKYDFQNRTPQETLNNFITALETSNLDLVISFIDPTYEARLNYRAALGKVLKSKDETIFLIEKFRRMVPFEENISYPGDYKFVLRNKDGKVESIMDIELNKETEKWVIQDF